MTTPWFFYYPGSENYVLEIGNNISSYMYTLYINAKALSNFSVRWYMSENGIDKGFKIINTPAIAEWI
jgi:hypothetical protein